MDNLKKSGYSEESIRKVASIISKKADKLEIIDVISFKTFEADIEQDLLDQADENDQVTYVLSGKSVRVIEIRKQWMICNNENLLIFRIVNSNSNFQ